MTTTPKTLTVTQCHQLLDELNHTEGTAKQFRRGIRNYTMALLMLDAGLRVGEVVQLRWGDLIFNSVPVTSIIVSPEIAKNKKERIIPVSQRLSDAIKKCREYFGTPDFSSPEDCAQQPLRTTFPVTTRQVERIIRAAAVKSIGRPVHPHMLRHTFGTKIERKAGLRVAQELLGHENVSSTQIYTHVNADDLKKAIREVCDDEQTRHLMMADSSLDSRGPDSIDAAGTNHNHR